MGDPGTKSHQMGVCVSLGVLDMQKLDNHCCNEPVMSCLHKTNFGVEEVPFKIFSTCFTFGSQHFYTERGQTNVTLTDCMYYLKAVIHY